MTTTWNSRHPHNPRPGTLALSDEQADAVDDLRHGGLLVGNAFPAHRLAEDDLEHGRDLLALSTNGPVRILPCGTVEQEPHDAPWITSALRRAERATGRALTRSDIGMGVHAAA